MPIFEMLRAFQETAALKSAIEIGVFTAIGEGARDAASIAAKCGASERGVRILCDILAANELLTKHNGSYDNSVNAKVFLDKNSPAYMGGITDFICDPVITDHILRDLTACVRKGATMMGPDGTVSDNNQIWVKFARAMAPITAPAAQYIASLLPNSGPIKVLDIAAGHGMFGIAVAKHNPEAQITALDWAAVLEVAKENAAKAGVADRYRTIPGSAFDVDYGTNYDVVLITNFLHHFDPETNTRFLRKVYAALKPGGKAITLDFVPDDDRSAPLVAVRFALTMLATTEHGDAYTFAEYQPMFQNAGFASNTLQRMETQQSVIISTK